MTLGLATAGESHGPALVAILTGLPAGLELDRTAIEHDLARRRGGGGRYAARFRHPQPRPRELGVGDEPLAARG
jgi:chorismate synthase